jgi:hypothetical protein
MTPETQEDVEDRALFNIPPTPPALCPGCERDACLLWKAERQRRVQARMAAKAARFGFTSFGYGRDAKGFLDYAKSYGVKP